MLRYVLWDFVFEFDFVEVVWRHVQDVFQTRSVLVNAYLATHEYVYLFNL